MRTVMTFMSEYIYNDKYCFVYCGKACNCQRKKFGNTLVDISVEVDVSNVITTPRKLFEELYEIIHSEYEMLNHPRYNDLHNYATEKDKLIIIFYKSEDGGAHVPISPRILKYSLQKVDKKKIIEDFRLDHEAYEAYYSVDGLKLITGM